MGRYPVGGDRISVKIDPALKRQAVRYGFRYGHTLRAMIERGLRLVMKRKMVAGFQRRER